MQRLAARYEGSIDALAPLSLRSLLLPAPAQLVPLLIKPHVLERGHLHRVWRALARAGFELAALRLLRLDRAGAEVAGAPAAEGAGSEGASTAEGASTPSLTAALAGWGAGVHGAEAAVPASGGGATAVARPTQPVEPAVEGTCAVLLLRKPAALRLLRALVGPASPARAKREGSFSLRAMFGVDDERNGMQLPAHAHAAAAACTLAFCAQGKHAPPPPPRAPGAAVAPGARRDDAIVPAGVMSAPARKLVRSRAASLSEVLLVAVPWALFAADPEFVPATLLERATAERFEVCAIRLAQLSDAQAARLLSRARAPALAAHTLSAGPCVLLALQRDNAIARFSALLTGVLRQLSPPHAYASASPAAAAADLADAFDELYGAHGFELVPAAVSRAASAPERGSA